MQTRTHADLGQGLPFGRPSIALLWLLGTGLAVLAGPFGTYAAMPFWERALYWSALNALAVIAAIVLRRQLTLRVPGDGLLLDILRSGLMAFVLGPLLWSYNALVYKVPGADLPGPAEHGLVVFALSLIMTFGAGAAGARATSARSDPDDKVPEVSFLRRLAPHLGDDILHITANDHYLSVVTAAGRDRVLLRFSDAIEDLTEHSGLRIHRSHWVAIKAIDRLEQEDRRSFVVLQDGTRLPVSRAYRDDLRRHGFDL